jgi:outer membrane protein assembly factor BamB
LSVRSSVALLFLLACSATEADQESRGYNESPGESRAMRSGVGMSVLPSGEDNALLVIARLNPDNRDGESLCAFVTLPRLESPGKGLAPCPEGNIWSGDGSGQFAAIVARGRELRIYRAKPPKWEVGLSRSLSWEGVPSAPSFSPSGDRVLFRYNPDGAAVWNPHTNQVIRLQLRNPPGGLVTSFVGWAGENYILRTVEILSRSPARTALQLYDARTGKLVRKAEFPGVLAFFSPVPNTDEVATFGDDGRSLYFFSLSELKLVRRIGLPPEHLAQGLYPYFAGSDTVLYISGRSPVDARELVRLSLSAGKVDWALKSTDDFHPLLLSTVAPKSPSMAPIVLVYEVGPAKADTMKRDARARAVSVKDGRVLGSVALFADATGNSAVLRFGDGSKTALDFAMARTTAAGAN